VVVVNNEKIGAGCYLEQVDTGLEVVVQHNILDPLAGEDIHRDLVVDDVVVAVGTLVVEVHHSIHLQPYCFC